MPYSDVAVVGVDADNTLWPTAHLYAAAAVRLAEALEPFYQADDVPEQLLAYHDANVPIYGFGALPLLKSMLEFCVAVLPAGSDCAGVYATISETVAEIHEDSAEPYPWSAEALRNIRASGRRVVMISKGVHAEQIAKLLRSGLSGLLDGAVVVAHKEPATYKGIIDGLKIAPQQFLMCGDSVASDVVPVLAAGGRAVLVTQQDADAPEGVAVVPRLSDAADLITGRLVIPADAAPADTDPEPADPEPEPADAAPADTAPADPDPEPADTAPADPEPADTAPADPEPADTAPADPEPADPEPADTAPADTQPRRGGRAMRGQPPSGPTATRQGADTSVPDAQQPERPHRDGRALRGGRAASAGYELLAGAWRDLGDGTNGVLVDGDGLEVGSVHRVSVSPLAGFDSEFDVKIVTSDAAMCVGLVARPDGYARPLPAGSWHKMPGGGHGVEASGLLNLGAEYLVVVAGSTGSAALPVQAVEHFQTTTLCLPLGPDRRPAPYAGRAGDPRSRP